MPTHLNAPAADIDVDSRRLIAFKGYKEYLASAFCMGDRNRARQLYEDKCVFCHSSEKCDKIFEKTNLERETFLNPCNYQCIGNQIERVIKQIFKCLRMGYKEIDNIFVPSYDYEANLIRCVQIMRSRQYGQNNEFKNYEIRKMKKKIRRLKAKMKRY